MSELQERNRAVWSSGNWDRIAELIAPVGPELLDAVGTEPGMKALDVGTGNGRNVAIPAAQRGLEVTGLDLTDRWFETGRAMAADAGVEVEFVVGDAQELPFEDVSFDRVLSTFGHMFAPDHRAAAQELCRVCKPGGVVGFTTWLRSGYVARMFALMGEFSPAPPPPGVGVPPQWGEHDHVREMLAPYEPEFSGGAVRYEFESVETMVDYFDSNFGPAVMLRAALGEERAAELREREIEMLAEFNEADDGTLVLPVEYLRTVVRR
jgi:SAM-dependent methyltransferase